MSARVKLIILMAAGLLLGVFLGILIMLPSFLGSSLTNLQSPGGTYLQSGSAAIGKPALDFTINSLKNDEIHLSNYRGHPLILNFWASWCAPCKLEMPYIQQRYQSLDSQLDVIGVNAGEPTGDIQTFVEDYGLTFDIGVDTKGEVQKMYTVVGLPVTYFIDEEGIIRAEHIGEMSEDQLDGYLVLLGVAN
jgi:cytochrome c biogenesis protein CcmG/thiol:disulfide interchange protein DsbE